MNTISERFDRVAAEVAAISPNAAVLAVSKCFPCEAIMELYRHGVRNFGENYADELAAKAAALPGDIVWHFIGHLQSNKVRKVLECADFIHSVDSERLAAKIDRVAAELGKRPQVLLEVNIAGESTKSGISVDGLQALAETVAGAANLDWRGLMTMAPENSGADELNRVFSTLEKLRTALETEFSRKLDTLSMGMSGDYVYALKNGATVVRIGSAIFGERDYRR